MEMTFVKRMIGLSSIFLLVLGGSCKNQDKGNSESSAAEINDEEGWEVLFDGQSFDGWHTYLKDTISDQWQIREGAMAYIPHEDKAQGINNLLTDKSYSSFELSLEWALSADGNSGVFYGIDENEKYPVPYMTAPEIQIRDYSSQPDYDNRKQMPGAIFGLYGTNEDHQKKAGEWNHFFIKIDRQNNLGTVALNGVEVVRYPLSGAQWDAQVKDSGFKDWLGFGKTVEGPIGLQDHGSEVWFRNIKIRELN